MSPSVLIVTSLWLLSLILQGGYCSQEGNFGFGVELILAKLEALETRLVTINSKTYFQYDHCFPISHAHRMIQLEQQNRLLLKASYLPQLESIKPTTTAAVATMSRIRQRATYEPVTRKTYTRLEP